MLAGDYLGHSHKLSSGENLFSESFFLSNNKRFVNMRVKGKSCHPRSISISMDLEFIVFGNFLKFHPSSAFDSEKDFQSSVMKSNF